MLGRNKKKKEADPTEALEYSDYEMDQMMDDSDIPGLEPEGKGSKTRSKNTRLALISFIALILIAGIYFGSKYYNVILEQKDKVMTMVGLKKKAPKISEAGKKAREEEKARLAAIEKLNREANTRGPEGETRGGKKPADENIAQEVTPARKEPSTEAQSGLTSDIDSKKQEGTVQKGQESVKEIQNLPSKRTTKRPVSTEKPVTVPSGEYAIQIGTFAIRNNATRLIRKFTERGVGVYGVHFSGASGRHTVYAGPFYSKPEAEEAAREIRASGIRGVRVIYNKKTAVYKVYIGKSGSVRRFKKLAAKIERMGFEAGMEMKRGPGGLTAVYIGNFTSAEEAERARHGLTREDVPSSLVVKRSRG